MPGFERHIVVARDPATVWAFLTSPARAPDWLRDVERVEAVGPLRAGAKVREFRKVRRNRETSAECVVTEWEDGRVFGLALEEAGLKSTSRYELAPDGDGTRVSWRANIEGRGLYRLLAGTVSRLLERRDGDRLERLRNALAAE
ncbi:MAG: SRPBCC family protein [Planctomycetota bacterium]|nr:SRPBCC family protein [Planctomycetota bacterium]